MDVMRKRTEAFAEGQHAWENEVDLDECPYHPAEMPAMHDDWIDGWNMAEMDYQTRERNRYQPRCACCGTTENLHVDNGSGGPYRCDSDDCMVF